MRTIFTSRTNRTVRLQRGELITVALVTMLVCAFVGFCVYVACVIWWKLKWAPGEHTPPQTTNSPAIPQGASYYGWTNPVWYDEFQTKPYAYPGSGNSFVGVSELASTTTGADRFMVWVSVSNGQPLLRAAWTNLATVDVATIGARFNEDGTPDLSWSSGAPIDAGQMVMIEWSSNLVDWLPLTTVETRSNYPAAVDETDNVRAMPQRFYRGRIQ
jgi:hypothetical protein